MEVFTKMKIKLSWCYENVITNNNKYDTNQPMCGIASWIWIQAMFLVVGKFLLLHQLSLCPVKMFLVLALRGYASNKENFNANNLYPWRSIQPIQLVLLLYSGYKKYPDTTMLYDVLTSCPKDIKLTACKERSFSSGFFYWASGEFYS